MSATQQATAASGAAGGRGAPDAALATLPVDSAQLATPAPLIYTRRGGALFLTPDLLARLRSAAQDGATLGSTNNNNALMLGLVTTQFLDQPAPELLNAIATATARRRSSRRKGRKWLTRSRGRLLKTTVEAARNLDYFFLKLLPGELDIVTSLLACSWGDVSPQVWVNLFISGRTFSVDRPKSVACNTRFASRHILLLPIGDGRSTGHGCQLAINRWNFEKRKALYCIEFHISQLDYDCSQGLT